MNKLKNWMNYLCLVPFMMVLATAWIIDPTLVNGEVAGKHFWFYLSMGLALLATIIAYLLNFRDIRFSAVDYIIDFIYLYVTAMYFGLDFYKGQKTQFFLFTLSLILYYLFRFFLYQRRWNVYVLVCFFLLTGFVEAIWGHLQLYGFIPSQHGLFTTTGSFFNPGPYAGYLAVIAPMALFYILRDRTVLSAGQDKRIWPFYIRYGIAWATFISILTILPATMSRASWIAATGGCALVIILYFTQIKYTPGEVKEWLGKYKKKIVAISIILLAALVISIPNLYYLKKGSADGRVYIWKTCIRTMKEYLILFGYGVGNFSYYYGEQQAQYFKEGKGSAQERLMAENPDYAFNDYLQTYIELGGFIFILFIIALAITLYWGFKRKRVAAMGGLVSLLIFAFMSYPFQVLPLLITFIFLISLCISRERSIDYYEEFLGQFFTYYEIRKKRMIAYICSFLILFTGIVTYCLRDRYPAYEAYRGWKQAKSYYHAGAYEQAIPLYKKYHPYLNDQKEFFI